MVLLDNDQFLSRLTLMFDKSRTGGGHVQIVMKRYDGRTKPDPRPENKSKKGKKGNKKNMAAAEPRPILPPDGEYMSLLRANYKNQKISSIVKASDLNKFQSAYCNLLKSNMDGLKRQKKVKTKKQATTQ